MTEKYTDVSYKIVPEDEDCILNAVQIGKIIDEPASTVRTWAKECEDYLYIKRINGSLRYTQASIQQFQDIKLWRREKDYPFDVIRQIMKKRGEGFGQYDGGLIDPKDPLGYDVLAEKILSKNKLMMNDFADSLKKYLDERESNMLEKVTETTAITVQEVLETNLPNLSKDAIDKITNEIKQNNVSIQEVATGIEDYLDKNKKEIEYQEKLLKDIDINKLEDNIDKKIKSFSNDLITKLEEQNKAQEKIIQDLNKKLEKRDIDICDKLKQTLNEKNEKKSFWKRMLNK